MARTTKALVLAAGLGTRLRPVTEHTPKCLVEIGGKPLLGYWFDALEAAGVNNVLLNTHHLAGPVEDYVSRVNESGKLRVETTHEAALLGSAGTISNNATFVDDADQCLIIYADNLSNVDLAHLLAEHERGAEPFTMLLFHTSKPKACGIATTNAEGRIVHFVEKPENPESDLANAGVYVTSRAAYQEIAAMNAFDLGFDVIPRFVGRMRGVVHDGYHLDIGTLEALERAQSDVQAGAFTVSGSRK